MSGIVMYDAIDLSQIPASPAAVGGYVDGRWPTFARLHGQFPGARLLSIAVTAAADADCLDIETGDATPEDAAAWYGRQKAAGVTRPCLYASASLMESGVIPAMRAAGIDRAAVRLWSAHYTGLPHICGPSSCGQMSIEADGCQWSNRAFGRDLDESLLLADFFGVPAPRPAPKPADWQAALMNKLPVLSEGATDKAGEVFFVHRVQALTRVYGEITGLADAAAQETTGVFDGATKIAVQQVQAHAQLATDGIVWTSHLVGADHRLRVLTGTVHRNAARRHSRRHRARFQARPYPA